MLKNNLNLQITSARCAPKTLMVDQKKAQRDSCNKILKNYGYRWQYFRDRIATMDESCVNYENPLDRKEASEWLEKGTKSPEVPKIPNVNKKHMASVCWYSGGKIHVEYMNVIANFC